MRFAGMAMEGFMDPNRPDMGGMAMNQDTRRSDFTAAKNEAEAYVGATGVQTAGKVEAAGILADAQASAAQAQGQASIMEGIGGIASSALGAFGGGGGSAVAGVARTSPGRGIAGSVAPMYNGQQRPYFGPAF